MTISEAIKNIILQKDDSLLTDIKRFVGFLRDLSPEYNKELNILQSALNERILILFFKDDSSQKSRIARVKMILEDKGLSEKWIDFIVDSFCSALGWKIENKVEQKVTENNFLNKEIDVEEAKRQFEEAQKQLEQAQNSKINEAHLKTQEAEKNFKEVERKSNLLKMDLESTNKRGKELQSKYDKKIAECLEIEKEYEKVRTVYENLKLKYENIKGECKLISKELMDTQVKSKKVSKQYEEIQDKKDKAKANFEKLNLEEIILKADYGDSEAQKNLANMYYNGKGVKQDYLEAFKWYKKSAEQDNSTAQYNLAIMYLKGQGVEKDKEEAIKWLQKSADQGDEDAKEILLKEKSNTNNPFLNNGSNFSDIFASFLNPKKEQKKQEEYNLELTPDEAMYGTLRTMQIPETQICEKCNGTGWIEHHVCNACRGAGHINKTIFLEVKIPAGVKDGTKIRVKDNILIVKII